MDVVETKGAPAAIGPYSQGVVAGGLLFASGQIALDPATGELVGETAAEQAEQVMRKATCFLADLGDFAAVNEVYARSFGAHLPARSAVQVAGLPKGALVEVEVVAEVPGA